MDVLALSVGLSTLFVWFSILCFVGLMSPSLWVDLPILGLGSWSRLPRGFHPHRGSHLHGLYHYLIFPFMGLFLWFLSNTIWLPREPHSKVSLPPLGLCGSHAAPSWVLGKWVGICCYCWCCVLLFYPVAEFLFFIFSLVLGLGLGMTTSSPFLVNISFQYQ